MTRDAVEIAKKLRRCATETWPFAGRVSNTGSPASDNNFGRAVAFMHEAADELDRLAALHASPVGAEPPSLSAGDLATLTELADDLERIVQEVSSRDGDATARQHRRAEALRKAVHAFRIPAQADPAAPELLSFVIAAINSIGHMTSKDEVITAIEREWKRPAAPSARPTPAAVPMQEQP